LSKAKNLTCCHLICLSSRRPHTTH